MEGGLTFFESCQTIPSRYPFNTLETARAHLLQHKEEAKDIHRLRFLLSKLVVPDLKYFLVKVLQHKKVSQEHIKIVKTRPDLCRLITQQYLKSFSLDDLRYGFLQMPLPSEKTKKPSTSVFSSGKKPFTVVDDEDEDEDEDDMVATKIPVGRRLNQATSKKTFTVVEDDDDDEDDDEVPVARRQPQTQERTRKYINEVLGRTPSKLDKKAMNVVFGPDIQDSEEEEDEEEDEEEEEEIQVPQKGDENWQLLDLFLFSVFTNLEPSYKNETQRILNAAYNIANGQGVKESKEYLKAIFPPQVQIDFKPDKIYINIMKGIMNAWAQNRANVEQNGEQQYSGVVGASFKTHSENDDSSSSDSSRSENSSSSSDSSSESDQDVVPFSGNPKAAKPPKEPSELNRKMREWSKQYKDEHPGEAGGFHFLAEQLRKYNENQSSEPKQSE